MSGGKVEFTGVLAERLRRAPELEPQDAVDDLTQQAFDKLPALLAHYRIDGRVPERDRFLVLAFMLACDFVPGFSEDPRGRPKNSEADFMKLVDDVRAIKAADPTLSARKIAERLADQKGQHQHAATIENKLVEVNRTLEWEDARKRLGERLALLRDASRKK